MHMLDRRMLLCAGAAAAGAAALAPTVPALAHAPQAGERAQPSFYRFKLGTIEVKFWRDPPLASKLPPAQLPQVTQTNLKLATPRLRLIKAGAEVVPGVTTFDTAGHTPGHMSVHIGSGSEEMLVAGDIVFDSEVSFLHPEWPFGFDLDASMGTKTRMAFLDRAATDRTLVST